MHKALAFPRRVGDWTSPAMNCRSLGSVTWKRFSSLGALFRAVITVKSEATCGSTLLLAGSGRAALALNSAENSKGGPEEAADSRATLQGSRGCNGSPWMNFLKMQEIGKQGWQEVSPKPRFSEGRPAIQGDSCTEHVCQAHRLRMHTPPHCPPARAEQAGRAPALSPSVGVPCAGGLCNCTPAAGPGRIPLFRYSKHQQKPVARITT